MILHVLLAACLHLRMDSWHTPSIPIRQTYGLCLTSPASICCLLLYTHWKHDALQLR